MSENMISYLKPRIEPSCLQHPGLRLRLPQLVGGKSGRGAHAPMTLAWECASAWRNPKCTSLTGRASLRLQPQPHEEHVSPNLPPEQLPCELSPFFPSILA